MEKFLLSTEALGYVTSEDETNADKRLLATGSQNVMIDRNRKVRTRGGYTRLGAGNTAATPVRNAFTWFTSSGTELPLRFYDDEWEVYLGTVDGTIINAWTRFKDGMSTTAVPRGGAWWDTGENLDLILIVQGNANIQEWGGGVAVVSSITGTTITKAGTTTFAQNRFYATRNKTLVCVRTGTEYTYTGGETTTTLTGISDTTGLVAGDILIQKVLITTNKPASGRNNDYAFVFENQLCLGSNSDNEVFLSKNTSYSDFAYSATRVSGEGGLLTLDGPTRAIFSLGSILVVSCGRNSMFQAEYKQVAVGSTLAETLGVKKLNVGTDQGAMSQETVVNIGDGVMYLTYEPAVRMAGNPADLEGLKPSTLSNPIKPDFDADGFTSSFAAWFKNAYHLMSSATSNMFVLNFIEDADGQVRRFWNPPQILPVGPLSIISDALHGHSNTVPETYELFTGTSDIVAGGTAGNPDDKVPMSAIAAFTYNDYGDRANDKNFDEYFVEGEITAATTDLLLTLNYNFGGATQVIERTISGSTEAILEGNVGFNSLGQQNLGTNPLGGLLNPPDDARKFGVIFEIAREDFRKLQAIFSTNEVDRYWAITAHGANAVRSRRKSLAIHQ